MARPMRNAVVVIALTVAAAAAAGRDVAKRVVNTPWWPPGTEKQAESVGIISHGFVYMTGMMEVNNTLGSSAQAELADVRDIAQAAGADLGDLVDCVMNVPRGISGAARRAFLAALPAGATPALTVVELPGEYIYTPTSVSCLAALPPRAGGGRGPQARHEWRRPGGLFGVSANGLLHIQGQVGTAGGGPQLEMEEVLSNISHLIAAAGGQGSLDNLVDCTAFVKDIRYAGAVRAALDAASQRSPPSLTIVEAGLEDPTSAVMLRCVAALPAYAGTPPEARRVLAPAPAGGVAAVVTDQFVYASGQLGVATDGADAFAALERVLEAAGVGLSDVVSCFFFVKDQNKVFDLFYKFSEVFNLEHPPPPTRTEFAAVSECAQCAVVAKCIAARHAAPAALVV